MRSSERRSRVCRSPGRYGVGAFFLPLDEPRRAELEALVERTVGDEGQRFLGWRDVPVDLSQAGTVAAGVAPCIRQAVIGAADGLDDDAFERKLYVIRRVAELAAGPELVVPSLSSRTLVYKGMLTAPQLERFYLDLADERVTSALALVHSRYSTNTFPSWELAHPYRVIAHNGEINTLRGNSNWMRARESQLASELFGDDLQKVLPVIRPGGSDTATFDNVLELLVLAGRSLPHALMMMIPEAYEGRDDMSPELRGFYAFHQCLMEAWDGPAAIAFTDGRVIGATLDRNGLRPGRWHETADGWVVLASETGVLDEDAANIVRKGRLQPGQALPRRPRAGPDRPRRGDEARSRDAPPLRATGSSASSCGSPSCRPRRRAEPPVESLRSRQLLFGYAQEDMKAILAPLARNAEEPVGSMGNDTPLAVLTGRKPLLYSYFKQLFAQVTNPPIDSIREAVVMSVRRERRLRAQPARRDARARAAARDRQPDPARRGARAAAARRVRGLQVVDDRHDVGRPPTAPTVSSPRSNEFVQRRMSRSQPARTFSSSPTEVPAPVVCRFPPCLRLGPCTTISSAKARACRRASSSSPASRAACTASPCSSATAQPP